MNRLRDDVGEDPVAERGIAMLRAAAATAPAPELKRRVWGAIQQRRLRAAAPRPLRRLRVAAVVAVVLLLAGTAGAVLSQRWIKRAAAPVEQQAITMRAPAHARTRAAAPLARPALGAREQNLEGAAAADASRAPAAVTAPPPAAAPAPRSFTHASRRTAPTRGQSARPSANPHARADVNAASERASEPASERERTEVLDALVALRRDRDPERAGRLLGGYLNAHPRGVLREEAMALEIEAAAARGDAGAARRLSREYQSAYPSGRFGAFARQHASGD